MMKGAIPPILFLLLFNLLLETARSQITRIDDEFGRKSRGLPSTSREADDTMIRRIEEEMLLLNKSGDPTRDKRALGILLQGFMEALGYTVTPIQLASLPNPGPAGMMPAGAAAAPPAGGMMMPMMRQAATMPAAMPAMMPNGSAAAPSRQRETLRFTGLFNLGNSENTTNLINHLSQYEQLFHGNRSAPAPGAAPAAPMPPPAAAPAPAPAAGPDIDPRSRPPLKEPLFVKIPLPIAPDLPPPQPPSPMPLDDEHGYQHNEYFNKDSSEEYSGSKDDDGQSGHFDEEDDDSHHREDFEFKHDKYHNSEDRNYENKDPDESHEQPKSKHVETGYQANKSVENYNVENKEIRDPSEVAVEGPPGGSEFNHATFVDEPNWKEEQDAKVYKIAADAEARAEALAEENAEREKQKDRVIDNKDEEEFHRSREKEIDEANEEHEARYDKEPYNDEEEDYSSAEKDDRGEGRDYKDDGDEGEPKEADHEEKGTQRTEARAQVPTDVPQPPKSYQDADFYPATLPLSYGPDMSQQGQTLRDSYGASLEKPGGRVDERVAEYITMFKNPQTGLYDPERGTEYEHARISFDHGDLIDGFNRIQKEYGPPQNKYEEYELDGERAEHRSGDKSGESKESLATQTPEPECECKKKKKKIDAQGARSSERTVTYPPPPRTSPQPDFGYGPYYSTMKYTYDPQEQDRNREIIARLTTYDTPTTARFEEDPFDLLRTNHSHSTVGPTIPPDRLTTMSFLHEAEAKEVQAWPAPFDFLYDNSEHKSVVYKKSPPVASSPAPFKPTRPSCNEHMMPFGEHKDKVKMIHGQYNSGERYKSDREFTTKPSFYHENRKAKPSEKVHKRVEYFPNFPTTQATIFEQRKRPPSSEKYTDYRTSTKPPSRLPTLSDILTPPPVRLRSTKAPRKIRKNAKLIEQTTRPTASNHRETTIKPTIKVKYTYPFGSRSNVKEETTNYVEKDGMLIIPEPTPYYFHEGFEEFTEEPLQSNTERVQIKEYRNHIASVKVSELKQLHPEGSMQIFKYSRNL